jgi:hypothetical protein
MRAKHTHPHTRRNPLSPPQTRVDKATRAHVSASTPTNPPALSITGVSHDRSEHINTPGHQGAGGKYKQHEHTPPRPLRLRREARPACSTGLLHKRPDTSRTNAEPRSSPNETGAKEAQKRVDTNQYRRPRDFRRAQRTTADLLFSLRARPTCQEGRSRAAPPYIPPESPTPEGSSAVPRRVRGPERSMGRGTTGNQPWR